MSDIDVSVESIVKKYINSVKTTNKDEIQNIRNAIKIAKLEWECSREFFESVIDEDLIDYAIYNQKACEQKYSYLLKKAKELELLQ